MKFEINSKEEWQEFIELLEFTSKYINDLTIKAGENLSVKQMDEPQVCYIEWTFTPTHIEANDETFTVNLPMFIKFVRHLSYPLEVVLGEGKLILRNPNTEATLSLVDSNYYHKDTPETKITATVRIPSKLFISTLRFCEEINDEVRLVAKQGEFSIKAVSGDLTKTYKEHFVCDMEGEAQAIYSLDYLTKLKLKGMLTLKFATDNPLRIESNNIKMIVAPRIYNEGDVKETYGD